MISINQEGYEAFRHRMRTDVEYDENNYNTIIIIGTGDIVGRFLDQYAANHDLPEDDNMDDGAGTIATTGRCCQCEPAFFDGFITIMTLHGFDLNSHAIIKPDLLR